MLDLSSGDKGEKLDHFPMKIQGMIYARALLVDLTEVGSKHAGLHIVTTAHTGHLYIIDPRRSCVDSIDLGEHAYVFTKKFFFAYHTKAILFNLLSLR